METNAIARAAKAQTAPAQAQGGAVAKTNAAPPSPKAFVSNLLTKQADAIKAALPAVMTPERFSRIALTAVSGNPKLQEAVVKSPMTFLGALMTAAQLGLEPNTPLGQAYLIPFNNKKYVNGTFQKVMECSLQIGYKGLVELAYRSGEVTMVDAQVVYENDTFEYELGLDPKLKHIPAITNRGKPIYYYGIFKTKNGASGFKCMSHADVLDHAKRYSKSFDKEKNTFSGPWKSAFDSMALKTVLIAALKYAPMKSDFVHAIASDNAVRSELTKDMVETPREDEIIDADYIEETPPQDEE